MRLLEDIIGWNPIGTAPLDEDVVVQVTDGRGEPLQAPLSM